MAVRPIRYGPRQYPPKYRPVGYGAYDPPPPAPSVPAPPRRFRLGLLLAMLALTVALHAGIAAANLGSSATSTTAAGSTEEVTEGASCDATGSDEFEGQPGVEEGGSDAGGQGQAGDAQRKLL